MQESEDPRHVDREGVPEPGAGEDEWFEPQDFSDHELLEEMKGLINTYQTKEGLFASFEEKKNTLQNNIVSAFNELLQEFQAIIFEYEGASLVTTKQEEELKLAVGKIEAEISLLQKMSKESLEENSEVVDAVLKTFHELARSIKSFEQK
jgi:hypothetical protein